jgi:uncharacterized membrane protein YjgN (DUF898 family)
MSNHHPPSVRGYAYDGRLSELYAIFIPNLLLTIITLGIYRFWAKTRLRHYLWSHCLFQGERFEYTGTGGELFRGFLVVVLALVVLGLVRGALGWALNHVMSGLGVLATIAFFLTLAVLGNAARFSAQRYRLTRSSWRGIRGGMEGSAWRYGLRALGLQVLSGITLGQYTPWMLARLAERRINASSFGNQAFTCETRPRALYGRFLLALVALVALVAAAVFAVIAAVALFGGTGPRVVALSQIGRRGAGGIYIAITLLAVLASWLLWTWFRAACLRHVANATRFGPLIFVLDLSAAGLTWLRLSNLAILVFTLGLGSPITTHRSACFLAGALQVGGAIVPDQLAQSTTPRPRTGEGLLDALDGGVML